MATVLLLDLILVPRFGLLGAGAASSIGAAIMLVVFVRGFLRHAKLTNREFVDHSLDTIGILRGMLRGRPRGT
jgi:O-antigen/teichoic acid export membrane protein